MVGLSFKLTFEPLSSLLCSQVGLDLVTDRASRTPAPALASWLLHKLRVIIFFIIVVIVVFIIIVITIVTFPSPALTIWLFG